MYAGGEGLEDETEGSCIPKTNEMVLANISCVPIIDQEGLSSLSGCLLYSTPTTL